MNSSISHVIVAIILCASFVVPVTSATSPDAPTIVFSYHKMTQEDADERREAFGLRDPSCNQSVVIDGFGTGLAPPTEEQLSSMVGVVNVLDAIEADFDALPDAVDLSTLPTFPAVGNQRSQPSCAAWAAAYYAYGFLEAVDNEWTLASLGEPSQLISPAWAYARSNGGRDLGSAMDDNMLVITDWGAATMATMPFDEDEYLDLGSPSAFREAPAHRADEMFTIDYSDVSTIEEIKLLVSDGTPVTFGIDANEYAGGFSDSNYVLSSAEYSSLTLNHAQTIIGYDDTITDDGEVGAFRVVNSWGGSFAEDGFYWFTYEALMELGVLGLDYLNYISDLEDYSPRLVANWHFNDAPSRSADIEVGVGAPLLPLASKSPFVIEDRITSHDYPTYMCVDITEFLSFYEGSSEDFFLDIGPSPSGGTISSFKVESHEGEFVPGVASRSSDQSADVPRTTPSVVTVTFQRYGIIDSDEAVDALGVELTSSSEVAWIPVEDGSAVDGDSMQTGDVGDGETTSLSMSIIGPMNVAYSWKVSSEEGSDLLSFSVPDSGIHSTLSGDVDWTEESHDLGEGDHTLYWNYSKDAGISDSDDTAWIDAIRLNMAPPKFSLEESYTAVLSEPFEVTPIDIENPSGSALSFWYDWGDGSPIAAGNPAEDHSASHVYEVIDDFDLTVWAADEYDHNISEVSVVYVEDGNAKPFALSISIVPSSEHYLPGDSVRFDVEVMDTEGDTVTVTVLIDALGVVMSDTDIPEAGEPTVLSFDYTCSDAREAPYTVEAEVRDDAEHFTYAWNTIETGMLVNSPPEASLEVDEPQGDVSTIFNFDASNSADAETPLSELKARWDWDNDGVWDTEWSDDLVTTHQFSHPGLYVVVVEVMDGSGLSSTDSVEVEVGGEVIPEFTFVLAPIVAVLAMLLLFIARTKAKR